MSRLCWHDVRELVELLGSWRRTAPTPKSHKNITSWRSIATVTGLALAWLITPVHAVAQNAYITNQGIPSNFSSNVTVIDTTTNKVVTTIDVGLAPSGVAVAPDGSKVYVANEAVKGTVSVIDAATNAVTATGHKFAISLPSCERSARAPLIFSR